MYQFIAFSDGVIHSLCGAALQPLAEPAHLRHQRTEVLQNCAFLANLGSKQPSRRRNTNKGSAKNLPDEIKDR
jgi:hypothetical protein